MLIPRSPKSNQNQPVQFFLKYHQETINSAHYFRYYDYQKLHTIWLPAMANNCECLRHAMVAFSALIYSIKANPCAREVAFYYYAVALQELRALLDTNLEYNLVIASALQLSSIDVCLPEHSNFSGFLVMPTNVYVILQVSRASCRNIQIQFTSVQPTLNGLCSNGIAITRTTVVFFSLRNRCSQKSGELKTFGFDERTSLTLNQRSVSSTIYGRDYGQSFLTSPTC